MNFFDNCKQCSIIVGNGSGVLFQPKDANYSYILTAKHNLKNKENIQFKFKKIYKHKSLDIAIIKIKKREFISPKIQITEPKDREIYKLYGYPSNRREEKIKIQPFDLIIRDIHNKYEIIVFNEDYDSEQGDIDGCSGGGVFKEENQDFLLAGIECRMDKENKKEENNTRLRFVSIKAFDEIVEKYSDELIYLDDRKNIEKSKKDNTIKEVIPLKNGKSLNLEFVKVELEKDKILYVGKYPVTFEEFDLFCNKTESVWGRGKNPIININWDDANSYCRWLTDNIKDNNIIFRLPTPEEWTEIATQNFSQDKFSQDNFSNKAKKVIDTEKGKLGIYGMYGNVHEWCYSEKCEEIKIVKGGSFRNSLQYISDVTKITKFLSEERNEEVSFRIIAEKIYNKNIQGE